MVTELPILEWLLPVAVVLIGGVVGAAVWIVRTIASRLIRELDRRLERIDDVDKDIQRVDADLKRLMMELPIHYQRREDAVRDITTLMARIDAVGTRIDHFVRREDHVRSETIINAKLDALAVALSKMMEGKP